jgi:DNA-binding transcriptional ArsR family regulator
MSEPDARANIRHQVLKALYDHTEENKRPGVLPTPSRGEMSRLTGIEEDEVAEALSFLTRRGLAQDEEFGGDGPTYSITEQGIDAVETTAEEPAEVAARPEHQPLIRDMDLVRALLLYVANTAREGRPAPQPSAEGYSDEVVAYHLSIMREAG